MIRSASRYCFRGTVAVKKGSLRYFLRLPAIQELLASDVIDLNPFRASWPACLKLPADK